MARVNRTTGFFLILGVFALLGTVAGAHFMLKPGEQPVGLEAPPAESRVFCSGMVDVTSGLAVLVPSAPGKVKEILVKEGESVKAGQVLVRLDDLKARNLLAVAEKNLDVAKARLEAVKQGPIEHQLKILEQERLVQTAEGYYSLAQTEFRQARVSRENGLIGPDKLELAEIAVLNAKKNHESAQRGLAELKKIDPKLVLREPEEALKKAELEVKAAREELEAFAIKSPSSGTIFEINYQVGGPCPLPLGDSNASRAMIFCPDEALVVRAEVDQEWAMLVRPGQNATLTFRAPGRDLQWTGTVEKVSKYIQRRRSRVTEPDQFNDSRTRECLIRIHPDPKNEIIHGMRMDVQIHTSTGQGENASR